MYRRLTLVLSLFIGLHSFAQTNLVLNPGFEKGVTSGSGVKQLEKTGYLTENWYVPVEKRSPRYYKSPERSVAKARAGEGALGMVLGGSAQDKSKFEYLTGEFSQPLVKDQVYCVSFYTLLHRSSNWSTSMGVMFHDYQDLIGDEPQKFFLEADLYANDGGPILNTKWEKYSGYYKAKGGETYLSLGNFGEAESVEVKEFGFKPYFQVDPFKTKAYYQFDDVSVIAIDDSSECDCAQMPPDFIEEEEEVVDESTLQPYLFAIDVSSSMLKEGVWDSLKNNMDEMLRQLPMGTPVTISTFASEANALYSGNLSEIEIAKIKKLMADLELGSGTDVYAGMKLAYDSWPSSRKDSAKVVLISDGVFTVNDRIENLVKKYYDENHRTLKAILIESKAIDEERLYPYQAKVLKIDHKELKSSMFTPKEEVSVQYDMVSCGCIDAYSDTMNYHFVVDYSGSMRKHKQKAIEALNNLYEQAPETAMISITAFSVNAKELYVGKKSDLPVYDLDALLQGHIVKGGTDPTPGVRKGLEKAYAMSDNRFSHLILITDLNTDVIDSKTAMKNNITQQGELFDLAVSTITVDLSSKNNIMFSGRSQFDMTTNKFREVSVATFEEDLFKTRRSGCDYTTQRYHYNRNMEAFKNEVKDKGKKLIKGILEQGIKIGG